jgi:hypothetical protein
MLLAL